MIAKTTTLDPYIVPALTKGLRLLALFSRSQPELTAIEIDRLLGLPHATVFRLLYTLEKEGLLHKTVAGYTLGPRILTLGYEYLSSQSLTETARDTLQKLCESTDTSANLGVLDGAEVIYIAHIASRHPLATRMQVGSRFPAATSSIGRLLLGAMSDPAFAALYAGALPAVVDREKFADLPEFRAAVVRDLRRGHVIMRGYYEAGLIAIAAPIFDHTGMAVAGLNISGPASTFAGDAKNRLKDDVCAAALSISKRLGYPAARSAIS
jgi:DNA-binding IclR family transcriptional regulator